MPRFAVLRHDLPQGQPRGSHWDLMFEVDGALRTFELAARPDEPGPVEVQPLVDHRLEYLDYEGPVSGGRGEVSRWDRGEYEVVRETGDELRLELMGERLRGTGTLKREREGRHLWRFSVAEG